MQSGERSEEIADMAQKPGYRDRVVGQLMLWVNGKSLHNTVDDECCPDFSCCFPDMFEADRAVRSARMKAYIDRIRSTSATQQKRHLA